MIDPYQQFVLGFHQPHKYYLIRHWCNGKEYYYSSMSSTDTHTEVVWNATRDQAFKFKTEKSVEQFKAKHFSTKNVELIRFEQKRKK